MTIQAQYTLGAGVVQLTDTPNTGNAYPATDPSALGNRPAAVYLQATTQDIRFTADGSTPTSSYGTLLVAGAEPFFYSGPLPTLKFIRVTSGAVLNVIYSAVSTVIGAQGAQGRPGTDGTNGAQGSTGAQGASGGGGSSGASGAVQTSDGAGGFDNIGTLPAALAALGVPVVRAVLLDADAIQDFSQNTQRVELVPAPSDGSMIVVQRIVISDNGATAVNVAGNFNATSSAIQWEGSDDSPILDAAVLTNFCKAGTAPKFSVLAGVDNYNGSMPYSPSDKINKALVLTTQATGPELSGAIVASAVNTPGTGYAINDTGEVYSNNSGDNATYIVTAVDGDGGVTAYTLTAPGTGFEPGQTDGTQTGGDQPGEGVDFAIDVSEVDRSVNSTALSITTSYILVTPAA